MNQNGSKKYKLLYFNERGKADLIKLILALSNEDYEDVQIKSHEWNFYKSWIPFEQLPALVINNEFTITHLNTICRYLAKSHNLNGSNDYENVMCDMIFEQLNECTEQALKLITETDAIKRIQTYNKFISNVLPQTLNGYEKMLQCNKNNNFIIANQLTYADLALVCAWEWLEDGCKQLIELYPLVKNHNLFIKNLPKVSAWFKNQKPLNIQKTV
jgi:glutathione S-transferase